jgi:hypothetical protein
MCVPLFVLVSAISGGRVLPTLVQDQRSDRASRIGPNSISALGCGK